MDTSQVEEQWSFFGKVETLLFVVNQYMAIYDRLKNDENYRSILGQLQSIPPELNEEEISKDDGNVRHSTPDGYSDTAAVEEKVSLVYASATETNPSMEALENQILDYTEVLGRKIQEKYGDNVSINFSPGPLKKKERVEEKTRNDYDNDARRVIDIVRCSLIFGNESIGAIKDVVDAFRHPNGEFSNDWSLVRVKNGFAKAENWIAGGYRDLKVNVRHRQTGQVIEMQLHLQEYYDLKKTEGHKVYTFARTQRVTGITRPVQVLDPDLLSDIAMIGEEKLKEAIEIDDEMEQVVILIRLGELYNAMRLTGKRALATYLRAKVILEDLLGWTLESCLEHKDEISPDSVDEMDMYLYIRTYSGICKCITEMQRDSTSDEMRPDKEYWRATYDEWPDFDYWFCTYDHLNWIDAIIEIASKWRGFSHPFTLLAMRIQVDIKSEILHQRESEVFGDASGDPERIDPEVMEEVREKNRVVENLFRQILSNQEAILGKDHPETIETMLNFAEYLDEKEVGIKDNEKDDAEAKQLLLAALAGAKERMLPSNRTRQRIERKLNGDDSDDDGSSSSRHSSSHHSSSHHSWSHHSDSDERFFNLTGDEG